MKGLARRIAVCGAAVLAAAAVAPAARGSDLNQKIKQQQAQLHAAHEKLQDKRGELGAAKIKVASLRSQLDETNRNIAAVDADLGVLEAQVHGNERRLAWNRRQLDAANASLQLHANALRRRIVGAYEQGDVSYLNVLLSATSFSDFVERWEDIRMLIDANQKTVRERRDAEARVAAVQRDLQAAQAQLSASVAKQQQARFALDALEAQRRTLVIAADTRRREVAQEVTELEGLSASEESDLQGLIVERQREEDARRASERRASGLAGEPAPSGDGSMGWPASGPITSPFGYRADPYGSGASDFHPGIDIGAPYGSTITAAADGTVIFAGWYGGYGNAVIIDHGGGVSSLYGHCSQILVSEHQTVQRGQAIAAVGSTGHSTGPHVHFEVRVNGSPVDPLSHLK